MASICVEKMPHSCGSSDGLQVFEQDGKYTGFCFSCKTYVPSPYNGENVSPPKKRLQKSPEEVAAEIQEISSLPVTDLPSRGLTQETLEYFQCKVALDQSDGTTPSVVFFPYFKGSELCGYKARSLSEKIFWSIGDTKEGTFFGWNQAKSTGAKKLFITEGEFDALATYQMLKQRSRGSAYEKDDPAIVSLRAGAATAEKSISTSSRDIKSYFKELVLVFDQDAPGQEAAKAVIQKAYPSARMVTLPDKDPNDCLLNGRVKAATNAILFGDMEAKNSRLVWGQSLYQEAMEPPVYGLSWPWKGLTKLTRGIRFGETYYIGAGVKMGKSEVVNAIGAHLIVEHGLPIFMAKPEEANLKSVKLVVGKAVGRIFHDPEIPFDIEAYQRGTELIGDNLCLLDLYQHLGWASLKEDIYAAVAQGCKAVFIDPITNLTNGVASGDANTLLQEIAQELAAMAKDLNIVIFIFCHLKAPLDGKPHERGGKVLSTQFAGSRAMMRSCNLMLGIEGNKDPDVDIEERNMRKIVLLEDREFGAVGTVDLYWDHKTSLFNEVV